jgi:hypothetical protein
MNEWTGSTTAGTGRYQTYTPEYTRFLTTTTSNVLNLNFDTVCIFNSCGSKDTSGTGYYCDDQAYFNGSFFLKDFSSSNTVNSTINSNNQFCLPKEVSYIESNTPTARPSGKPSPSPSARPTTATPSYIPTVQPTPTPSEVPSVVPSGVPSVKPSANPTTATPTAVPSSSAGSCTDSICVSNSTKNAITFNFNVTLLSGDKACKSINAAVKVDSSVKTTLVQMAWKDVQTAGYGRYASDFELVLRKSSTLAGSQFIVGNPDSHILYGREQIGTYDVTYQQYLTECIYWTDYTSPVVKAGFDQVCIYNACGSNGQLCHEYTKDTYDKRQFIGQVIINNFKTTTVNGNAAFDPPCTPYDTTFVTVPTQLPTSAPPSAIPTVRPSRVPSSKPTRKPVKL